MDSFELMSPVGSYESLFAAIEAGCDSIYFGIGDLNMRSQSAANFCLEDLDTIAKIARENRVKSYLTLNTVIYDTEMQKLEAYVQRAKFAGISAVIASDFAVIKLAQKHGVPVHISTQSNISNYQAVEFFSQFADTLVLARELDLAQVRSIAEQIEKNRLPGPNGELVKIEMFVHGALCMATSGKCYLSLHDSQKSANRGQCLQNCRRTYLVTDKESGNQLEIDNEYIMSPKDLCTIDFIDELLDAGVRVLKIEGRARSPEYVKVVTRAYKTALEAYKVGALTPELKAKLKGELAIVFNRGFWGGYYLGQQLGEWNTSHGSQAVKTKVYSGKVNNYFSKLGVVEIKVESSEINIGDDLLIMGPSTGVLEAKALEIRINNNLVTSAPKSSVCSIKVSGQVRKSDKVYRFVETAHLSSNKVNESILPKALNS